MRMSRFGNRRCMMAAVLLCLQAFVPVHAMEAGASGQAANAGATNDEALRQPFSAVVQTFDGDVQGVLNDIEGMPRRLLALRSYLRAGESLRSRWSWTEAEVAAFRRSARYQQMLADVQRLTKEFEALNPGVTLYVNTEVRTLGVQLERWNKNRTVGLLGDALLSAARAASIPSAPSGTAELRQFLIAWRPAPAVPLAAPGLSLHGRGEALDFQIRKGDRIIAGTDTASVGRDWDAQGWTEKLQQAVKRSGAPFRGPLQAPREPWHYEYAPQASSPNAGRPK